MDMSYIRDVPLTFIQDCPWTLFLLSTLGALSVGRFAYQTLSVLLQTFVLPGTSLNKFGVKKGAWAVITGATGDIGQEFSFQLAKAGFNVFLVGRNKRALSTMADEIAEKYGVETAIHAIDFVFADDNAYSTLNAEFLNFDVGVLVNNAGKSHDMPNYFVDTPEAEMKDIASVNINSILRVTYAVLPGMVKRKRGLILNIGSFAGTIPSPMLCTYSATKAFMSTFTSALAEEVRKDNVVVENVNTHFVVSKLSKIRKPSVMAPLPGPYVRAVLSKIGLACGAGFSGRPGSSTPYWSHALMDYAITLVGVPSLFISYAHVLHHSIRERALKKRERERKAL